MRRCGPRYFRERPAPPPPTGLAAAPLPSAFAAARVPLFFFFFWVSLTPLPCLSGGSRPEHAKSGFSRRGIKTGGEYGAAKGTSVRFVGGGETVQMF